MKSLLGKLFCGLLVLGAIFVIKTILPIANIFIGIGVLAFILIAGTITIALSILQAILESLCSLYEKVSDKTTPLLILNFISFLDKINTYIDDKYHSIK